MGRGMRFLAALALLWATSTRAASITRADQASLVQQLVRDHRGEASMSLDKAGVAAAVVRTAMNHSYHSMLKDTKKRAVFAHMMARLANLVGAAGQSGAQSHNAKDLQAYLLRGINQEAVLSCLTGPGLTAADFLLNLPNAIDNIKGCTGDAYCLTKEILGMIGEVGDNLVDLFHPQTVAGRRPDRDRVIGLRPMADPADRWSVVPLPTSACSLAALGPRSASIAGSHRDRADGPRSVQRSSCDRASSDGASLIAGGWGL